ncbi:winged helix-turn-helix domain-containing protein [Embleya sp. NPDC005575]|uniref:ArsR/SmtB family transcription factor n=1 Tax=Embleya sp. NPDC005575 TaxID=3156892 RepID=UPI0033A72803
MIRIDLSADALAHSHFAISPVTVTVDLLMALHEHPAGVPNKFRDGAVKALTGAGFGTLNTLGAPGAHGYCPDFLRPIPNAHIGDLDDELHTITTTGTDRVRHEIDIISGGGKLPGKLARATEQGERQLTQAVADQLARLFHTVIAPDWPRIRDRLEADIAARARVAVTGGLKAAIDSLDQCVVWNGDGIDISLRYPHPRGARIAERYIVFQPSPWFHRTRFAIDPPGSPDRRSPIIHYPAKPDRRTGRDQRGRRPAATGLGEVMGETRALILAELGAGATTAEVAGRLRVARSTASHHLQLLYRAGLVDRRRDGKHVVYRRARLTAIDE